MRKIILGVLSGALLVFGINNVSKTENKAVNKQENDDDDYETWLFI